MAEQGIRLRILFEDGKMLNKSHRKNGLKRSWIHHKPNHHKTIHDLASYLTRIFDLHISCPNGLLLSMDGFVLPSFETTCILKDKDLICVKKKNGTKCIKVEEHEQEIVERQPLAIGYKSESEEVGILSKDSLLVADAAEVTIVSKKRKASGKLGSSEKKKKKRTNVTPCTRKVDVEKHEIHPAKIVICKRKSSDVKIKAENITPEICKSDVNDDPLPKKKWSHVLDKDCEGSDIVNLPEESKKLPSRSARRKKAKRQWLRQSSILEKKELNSLSGSEKNDHRSARKSKRQSPEKGNQHSSEKCKYQSVEKHNHQSPNKGSTLSSIEENHMDIKQESQSSGTEEEVVPVVVRPGHIRFEPLGKASAVQQNESPVDNFQWNGITSKKKGQKWGSEKGTYDGRSTDYIFKHDDTEMQITEEKAPHCPDPIDFDKLMPCAGLPEKGDLIAYRLIELSSSWCPEVSPFRVGKVSQYDSETSKVTLETVLEYPLVPEKKSDEGEEEESAPQLDTSLYGEDGSLEIEFLSLIDVRIIKSGNPNAAKKATATANGHANDKKTTLNTTPIGNNSKGKKNVAPTENGGASTWDEISEALSAKKALLSQQNDWQKNENSSNERQLPYRVLRGSALGPTIAILRAQNAL